MVVLRPERDRPLVSGGVARGEGQLTLQLRVDHHLAADVGMGGGKAPATVDHILNLAVFST